MNLLFIPLFLPLLFFLPGYLFARTFIRNAESFSEGARWFIPIAASVCLTTWLGLTLAEFGAFSIWYVAALDALWCALLWLLGRKHFGAWSLRVSRPDWIFLALLTLALILFARPAEYALGNSDAGTYINTGANIARTGAIAIYDAQVAQLPFDSAKAFYWQLVNPFMLYKAVRLPGFFIADVAQGLALPQFLQFYPTWLALWDSLLGVELGLYATPLIALLGSVAFYFLAQEIYRSTRNTNARNAKNFARLAFFLLIVCVPQFWFARYPVAEAMTQFLVLTGMWALLKFERARDNFIGMPLFAGVAFGQVFFTRADAVLLLVPLVLYALILIFARAWRRAHWAFFGAFGVVLTQAAIHMFVFAPNYLYYQYSHALRMQNIDKLLRIQLPTAETLFSRSDYFLFLVGAAGLGVVALFLVDRVIQRMRARWGKRVAARFGRGEKYLRIGGAILLGVLFVAFYFILPRPESLYAYVGGLTPARSEANLLKLGWYLSPIGIVLTAFGAVIVTLRDLNARNVFFYGAAGLFAVFYLDELYSNPHYIYTTRHYIPLVIPLFIVLAARALDWLWHDAPRQKSAHAIAAGAFGLWMVYNAYAMGLVDASRAQGLALRAPFVTQTIAWGALRLEPIENAIVGARELGGAYAQIQALAQTLDPNAVIIFSAGRDEPAALATPLKFIFGRDAFVSVFNNPPGDKIAALIDHWRAQGRPVILAYGANGGRLQIPGYALERVGAATLDAPQWAFAYDFMPRSAWRVNLNYTLYRAVPGRAPDAAPTRIDFGGDDFPHLMRGFMERAPEATARWIGALAPDASKAAATRFVSGVVRWSNANAPAQLQVTLRARAPREGARLIVKSGDQNFGGVSLTTEFADYSVMVDSRLLERDGASFLLELVVEATPDGQGRLLGAELEWLKIAAPK